MKIYKCKSCGKKPTGPLYRIESNAYGSYMEYIECVRCGYEAKSPHPYNGNAKYIWNKRYGLPPQKGLS